MKFLAGIMILAAMLIASCKKAKRESADLSDQQIKQIDSLIIKMDSVRDDIDSSIIRVDMLIEDL